MKVSEWLPLPRYPANMSWRCPLSHALRWVKKGGASGSPTCSVMYAASASPEDH
ncbi:hypothetical protein M2389_001606 [Microbacterium phyllosphaerae]|nr:hypothetical protein [Microbacterium phyllosphaerae]